MALKANANKIQIGRARKLPVKKTINLMYKEKTRTDIVFTLLIFMLYLVALYFFSKYGVSAQLSKADAAESHFNQKLEELHALQAENNEYANVITEYSHYGNGFLTESEVAAQDKITMLNVLDQRIHTTGGIQNIKIVDNIAHINLGVPEAEMIPEIIKQLEESEYVGYVTAQTASTVDKKNNTQVEVDEDGNVLTPLYVDASITVNFRSPAEVEAALANGETAVDAYLDASPTGFATGTNVYVPAIIEQPSEDTEEKTEEKKDTKKEDKSSKDNKSKSSSDSKSSSSKSSSSSSSSDAKAKAQAAQKAADAQAASQQQAAAKQREQQAAQAAAQAQAQQQAASSASSQTSYIDTDTSQFGGNVTISGGSPTSTSGSPISSSTSGPTVGTGASSDSSPVTNSSFGPSSPLGTVDSSINPLH
ncbi:hypothetical protein SAMN05216349_10822 [Oribacterium sp. KHPX15]|uniref:hypothetical protein n=1 Tax=Oribacterium sp. KHPX15 TaxID=1855342 RepID=UPI000899F3D6|nr:hypothetical protein [Oribacterium sp. KHPX15]SEA26748.1 hypothetical protein SAMN05216349_10822 [Oribacterium sp. KHPX15]